MIAKSRPFNAIASFLLDAFFPKYCLLCNRLGECICASCETSLPFEPQQVTPWIFSATLYSHRSISQLIHQWKYQNVQELTPVLGELLLRAAQHFQAALPEAPMLIPVPLHRRRERARGFHHTLQLAQFISQRLHWPLCLTALIKQKATPPQMQSNGEHRRQNLIGSFSLRADLPKRPLLLIDDVITTGSTLQECIRILQPANPVSVHGLAIASAAVRTPHFTEKVVY